MWKRSKSLKAEPAQCVTLCCLLLSETSRLVLDSGESEPRFKKCYNNLNALCDLKYAIKGYDDLSYCI